MTALLGESLARNRYTYFAAKASEEGFRSVSDIFEKTALQEKEHARMFFMQLEDGGVPVDASFSTGALRTTKENLQTAANGEKYEWSEMYPSFADVADKEGFPAVAELFRKIAVAEKLHEQRFNNVRDNIDVQIVMKSGVPVSWSCSACGYFYEGPEAPDICPLCGKPKSFFDIYVSLQV